MAKNKRTGKLSEHFSNRDFSCKCGNCSNSIRISLGLIGGLEGLRSKLKQRVNIVKGFICSDCAEKTNEKKRTFHTSGLGACVQVNQRTCQEIFLAAEQIPEFKGIGLNLDKDTVHVDTRKEDEREIWVIENGRRTNITDDNREKYFPQLPEPTTESKNRIENPERVSNPRKLETPKKFENSRKSETPRKQSNQRNLEKTEKVELTKKIENPEEKQN
ncbi:hypothetical protein HOH45_04640 [bacterium]|jgi:hypothetical protein|nr:hypothetical protein [bacterium]